MQPASSVRFPDWSLQATVALVSRPWWTRPNWYAEDIKTRAHQRLAERLLAIRRILGPAA